MSKVYSTIKIPTAEASQGGSLQGFVWNQLIRGFNPQFGEDFIVMRKYDNNFEPSFADLIAVVQAGGYFEGIKLGLEFANTSAAQQQVPVEVRGSNYVDENGDTQNRTWIEWLRANTTVQIIRHTSGSPYVTRAAFNGQSLNSDEFKVIHAQSGISVIEWDDVLTRYNDRVSEDNPDGSYEDFEM